MLNTEIMTAEGCTARITVPAVAELPPRYNRRWGHEQRQQLLDAIDAGVMTIAEAADWYALTPNDIADWRQVTPPVSNTPGASATRTQLEATAPSVDRLARLVEVLLQRQLIDQFDVVSLDIPRNEANTRRLWEFMVDDEPLF